MPGQTTVVVEYVENNYKKYDFFTDIPDLAIGDKVVVLARTGLGIARVVGFRQGKGKADAWIICRIDVDGHYQKLTRDKKLKVLEHRMRVYLGDMDQLDVYRAIAETHSEMATILDEYLELGGSYNGI